ncbi:HTH-type transcriptional regulator CdhR [Streptomyces sp. ADI95-16]|uniref:GlxA family transcriptional regulator n=1 Tax=Streptomyces sp. ADI95-16 TaxID=1522758 RepID=UPI000F3A9529|nr:helix-turn-helix domain-containing protein [Streptomyces sp. ADI95-16]AYV25667.1 HTH-type transcriptional regulator CdhR [Streptomyces sp. ADI95-16]
MSAPRPHRVVIVAFPGVELLDVTGPAEVFSVASRAAKDGHPNYTVQIATEDGGTLTTSSGVRLLADLRLDEAAGKVDTLLVSGAVTHSEGGAVRAVVDPVVTGWLRTAVPRAGRTGSVCAGAHLLAAAGLLDGRSATTHWLTAAQLAATHPEISVDADAIFVRSGSLWTCAGITSGMDMALAMVAEDHGHALALTTARMMVMYVKRSGGQSQFSVPLSVQEPACDHIGELRQWITEHPDADLSTDALAQRVSLSTRHFSRLFVQRTGTTPAAYVESARLETARRLLEESDAGLPQIAATSGLGSLQTLHRTFQRHLGTTPAEYRRRFR